VSVGALLVGDAAGGLADAAHDGRGVRHEAIEAGTLGSLIHHLALSVWTTGAVSGAWIFAAIADA